MRTRKGQKIERRADGDQEERGMQNGARREEMKRRKEDKKAERKGDRKEEKRQEGVKAGRL